MRRLCQGQAFVTEEAWAIITSASRRRAAIEPKEGIVMSFETALNMTRMAEAVRGILVAGAFSIAISPAAFAATITVTNCNDSGDGSLRQAVVTAATGSTIDMTQLSCPSSDLFLTSGPLAASGSIVLRGPGATKLNIFQNTSGQRVLVHTGAQLSIYGLTISHGHTANRGGCIYSNGSVRLEDATLYNCFVDQGPSTGVGAGVFAGGNLTLVDSNLFSSSCLAASCFGGGAYVHGDLVMRNTRVGGNGALSLTSGLHSFGGGIFVKGNVDISGSEISGNIAGNSSSCVDCAGNAAGLLLSAPGAATAKIVNSTVTNNFATGGIGGIYSNVPLTLANSTVSNNTAGTYYGPGGTSFFGAGVTLYQTTGYFVSSIIFGNRANYTAEDVDGKSMTISGSHNLIGSTISVTLPVDTLSADPLLGDLQLLGGRTETRPLGPGSPAIATGNNVFVLSTDQRGTGFARKFAGHIDIGAFQTGDSVFNDAFGPSG